MSAMDHAGAHERIEELLLEPARLRSLASSAVPDDVALREHVAGCPACRADLEGWVQLQRRIADAVPRSVTAASAEVEPYDLPPSLRDAVVAAARKAGRSSAAPGSAHGPSRRAIASWLGLAASIVVLAGASVITVDQVGRRAAAQREAAELATLVEAVDAVLAGRHKTVELQRPDGSAAGSISWSRHDWVVLTSALEEPVAGTRYTCWLEDGGGSVRVGLMEFAGDTAYWVATLDDWATWEIGPETQFVVSLEADGAKARTGQILLSADLGT